MPKVATISVYVADMSQAIEFYTKQLGFQVAAKPNPYITVLKNDGPVIVLCQAEKQHRHSDAVTCLLRLMIMRKQVSLRSFRAVAVVLVTICGPTSALSAQAAGPLATHPVALPAWLSGCWERRTPRSLTEEQWMAPRAGTMLGFARTTRGDSLLEYEFLRIHRRGVQLVYEAHPSGQKSAEFPGTVANDTLVAFANPAHDFPQRIFYRRLGRDSLLARIEGTMGDKVRGIDFQYARVDCPTGR